MGLLYCLMKCGKIVAFCKGCKLTFDVRIKKLLCITILLLKETVKDLPSMNYKTLKNYVTPNAQMVNIACT